MPLLNWIGKDAVVNPHHQVLFHLLKDLFDLARGQPSDGNLLVQVDNIGAFKTLPKVRQKTIKQGELW